MLDLPEKYFSDIKAIKVELQPLSDGNVCMLKYTAPKILKILDWKSYLCQELVDQKEAAALPASSRAWSISTSR